MDFKVIPYSPDKREQWNSLVKTSRNGTFLHLRDYLEYHADRFTDASAIAIDRNEKIIALLPATAHGGEIRSHGGLTYGGWVMGTHHPNASDMGEIWLKTTEMYRENGFKTLLYKAVPHIYHRYPAEDDLYPLWRMGARLETVNISATIDLDKPLKFNNSARLHLNHAKRDHIIISFEDELSAFWKILQTLLQEKYGTSPVHSLDEIRRLKAIFPGQIQLLTARDANDFTLLGGMLLYVTDRVVHAQYIATTPLGREKYVIPLLVSKTIERFTGSCRYLDLGTSNEDNGRTLNTTLLQQKNGFGAMGIAYTQYRLDF